MEIKRYKLICCEILFREISFCLAGCKNIIDVKYLPKALHDMGESKMSKILQEEIDATDLDKYDAILLGYGLCNNGIRSLHAGKPMVVTRAHDCITLLMGSRQKYNDYFYKNPGTYFKSSGWIERDTSPNDSEQSITSQLGMNKTYQQYVEEYGEDNAKYLMEMLGDWTKNYRKITYINTNVGNLDFYREISKKQAGDNEWEYEEMEGSTGLLFRLLNGDWDNDFLVVPPGSQITASYNEDLISF